MTSPINYTIDDKDLDDAALWAVIDSAAASLTASKSLAIKKTIPYQSPKLKFISPLPSPQVKSPRNHRISDGEVLQSDSNNLRPQKIARSSNPVPNYTSPETTSPPLAMVNHSYRTPTYTSPDATDSPLTLVRHAYQTPTYTSPDARASNVNQFSPIGSDCFPKSYNQCKDGEFPRHSLAGQFPSVSLFKEYQNAAMSILEKSDYTMISGHPFIKKAGWRKISFYFNVSYEIKDKTIEFDGNRDVQRAEFVVRAHMLGGRFSDGWGSCERREKRFLKPNHDIPSTAETRAKNKACQDLLGIGEYRPGSSNPRPAKDWRAST
ncbi:Peptide transporter family 1 [Heracleum sosnowskyi]|uniref:Peptide transporter family 1 n=1 Tax=Heracleum sosnowskyi TaxID=360622 RepID=A0AAD8NBB7_9APIA|nr:Peptide transporter family 1 [Heracleum sosnowskyi]